MCLILPKSTIIKLCKYTECLNSQNPQVVVLKSPNPVNTSSTKDKKRIQVLFAACYSFQRLAATYICYFCLYRFYILKPFIILIAAKVIYIILYIRSIILYIYLSNVENPI